MGVISKLRGSSLMRGAIVLKKYKPPKIPITYETSISIFNLLISDTLMYEEDNSITAIVSKDKRYKVEILTQQCIAWLKAHTKSKYAVIFFDVIEDNPRVRSPEYFLQFPDLANPINSKRFLYIPCPTVEDCKNEVFTLINTLTPKEKVFIAVNGFDL